MVVIPTESIRDRAKIDARRSIGAAEMHEFGIARNIVETVTAESARLAPGSRVVAVGLRIGVLSGVEVESLSFCFQGIVADGQLDPLDLRVEQTPHMRHCRDCSSEFEVDVNSFIASCPRCGNRRTEFVCGDELEISYVEVEED